MKFLRMLNGNNRILAILLLLAAGAIKAAFGVDVVDKVDALLALVGISGEWLAELSKDAGLQTSITPTAVAYAGYCVFAIINALRKRSSRIPEVPTLVEARQVLGLMGGVQTGPGAAAPVGNQDLGAAIAVIRENPNGFIQGIKILAKVLGALFSRGKG